MIPGLRVPRDTISMLIFRNSPGADEIKGRSTRVSQPSPPPCRRPLGLSLSRFTAVDEVWRQFQSGAIKDLPTAQQEVMRVARETIGQ